MKIYNVFYFDEFAGTFWQTACSSPEKAEEYKQRMAKEGYDVSEWYVEEFVVDSE